MAVTRNLNEIPNIIHAIWLGSVLDREGQKMVAEWKKVNPSYECKLWIDSSTYYTSDDKTTKKNLEDYTQLRKWAKDNKIILCDINPTQKEHKGVRNELSLYHDMPAKTYFNDELTGEYKNLAAASDILRVAVLEREGGIYHDAKDVFPKKPLPNNINAKLGLLCNIPSASGGALGLANDLIASVPNGKIIGEYQRKILANYNKLYENPKLLAAHRNALFSHAQIYSAMYGFGLRNNKNFRTVTTMYTSGPSVLAAILFTRPDWEQIKADCIFPKANFKVPETCGLSWLDPKLYESPDKLQAILRSHIRDYFNYQIDEQISNLQNSIQSRSSKGIVGGDRDIEAKIMLLNDLKLRINALPPTVSMVEVYKVCVNELDKKDLIRLDSIGKISLLTELDRVSKSTEAFINYCNENLEPKQLATLIEKSLTHFDKNDPFSQNTKNLEDFVQKVLNTENGKPNMEELKTYIPEAEQEEATSSFRRP